MAIQFYVSAQAYDEIGDEIDYYKAIDSSLSRAFSSEINQAFLDILSDPDRCPEVRPGLRRWFLTKRFRWRIIFKQTDTSITIIAAYNSTAQSDPYYWRDRI